MTFEQAQGLFHVKQLPLTPPQFDQLEAYLRQLLEVNQHMNLTAIVEPGEVWAKHFLDSALLLRCCQIPEGAKVLDVGTGAGFPGMVLAILRPDLQVTLLDSLQKRVHFLEDVAKSLGLAQVVCVHSRAEDAAKSTQFREQFDFVTARAVAELPVLAEYCLPFLTIGGTFGAMKGPSEDADRALNAFRELGGQFVDEIRYEAPQIGQRCVYVVKKVAETPGKYPRRGDKIRKKPL